MTQLIIAGVEVVLPQTFSVTVKRENSFFTKNGEYTYDCTLRLDNTVNQQLYGFLHRLNKTDQVATRRTAILMADGHVYCRGTEIVTKWTDQTVSIQIVSGESELNFFVGQEQKIEDLDLGEVEHTHDPRTGTAVFSASGVYPAADYCLPTVRLQSGYVFNRIGISMVGNDCPQPYLCTLLTRILEALGYNRNRTMVNQLADTQMKNLFIVNTMRTTEMAKMIPGWTVKDFLQTVEKLTGAVFVTDNSNPTDPKCDLLLKTQYYLNARQLPITDVVDNYEAEVNDEGEAEFTASNVCYNLPEHHWAKLMQLPEGVTDNIDTENFSALYILKTLKDEEGADTRIYRNTATGRLYVLSSMEQPGPEDTTVTEKYWIEVDQYKELKRENTKSTLELEITPAPMAYTGDTNIEVIDLTGDGAADTGDEESPSVAETAIRAYQKKESSPVNLYAAFYSGTLVTANGRTYGQVAYTDAYHAMYQNHLHYHSDRYSYLIEDISGSLRLADRDADYYQGGSQIDTAHAITFETFDPNHIDVRQVYVIGNKRYVVRDVEETITAEGRRPLWRLTCYPITITDEAIENRWILTRGVWDDGGAWLDDGRWNDGQN